MVNNLQIQSQCRCPLWLDRSPQDGRAGHCRWPWRQPMEVHESCIRLRVQNLFGVMWNSLELKKWWVLHYDDVFQLNWISILSIFFDWPVHSESHTFVRFRSLRWLSISHCAERWSLNLLTAVSICCMFNSFYVPSWIVANISESSLLLFL